MENILVKNSSGEIKHQGQTYILQSDNIVVLDGETVLFYFCDMNEDSATVYEIDELIIDFVGNKFLYVDSEVVSNPDYVEQEE